MNPYHNIFFYYRGPQRLGTLVSDTQLENNTTKALVNVLEYGGDELLHAFLREVDASADWHNLAAGTKFRLQTDGRLLSACRQRFVVAITPDHPYTSPEDFPSHQEGLPDALVYAMPAFGLIVEDKIAAPLVPEQLERHAASAGWSMGSYATIYLTWQALYRAFESLKLTSRSGFLRDQFLEYLRLIEVAPFDGFKSQDFDHFIGDDPEYRGLLRGRLREFSLMVAQELPPQIREIYPNEPVVGKVDSERGAWARFPRDQDTSGTFNHCNLDIGLTAAALSFNAVLRDGKVTDKNKPIGMLHRRLSEQPGWFLAYLASLGTHFELKVFRRTNAAGADKILPGGEKWNLVHSQRLDVVLPEGMTHLGALLQAMPYPGIHLSFELPRTRVLKMTAGELKTAGIAALTRLHRFVQFVELGHD